MCPEYINRCRKLFSFSVICCYQTGGAPHISRTLGNILIYIRFYHVIPNLVVRNEPNLDSFQGKYRRSDVENIGSMCFMVRQKIGLQTDGQTDTANT